MYTSKIEGDTWWDLIPKSIWKNNFWNPQTNSNQHTNKGSKSDEPVEIACPVLIRASIVSANTSM